MLHYSILNNMKRIFIIFQFFGFFATTIILFEGCTNGEIESEDPKEKTEEMEEEPDPLLLNKGIGPISTVQLGPINPDLVKTGEDLFNINCSECHALEKKIIGPPLAEVTIRRSPEWIMNMILNPTEMVEKDPIAQGLFVEYDTVMVNKKLTQEQARSILEFFRDVDKF